MNEDEAFIRAIVDNPGEDTARLVYADWLDDRDDPRGAYLRAEHEALESGNVERLGQLSDGLNSVWVARVSRPPRGICCDRLRFSNRGDPLSEAELTRFVARHNVHLDLEYRAFLLNYNGGSPDHGRVGAVVDRFYRLGGRRRPNEWIDLASVYLQHKTDYLGRFYRNEDEPWHWQYLPIATLHEGGNQLCLGIGEWNAGRIYSLVHNTNYHPENATRLASSLAEFFDALNGRSAAGTDSSRALT